MTRNDQVARGAWGRPSKLTPQLTRRIVAAIVAGATSKAAAEAAGIDEGTFHRWMQRGERGEPHFRPRTGSRSGL